MSNISDVIGEGTYGCAIKPSLKCNNKTTQYNNKISKVLLDKHAKTELKEYNMIDKIDKNKDFYMGKPELCKPKYNDSNVKSIQKCKSISKVIKDNVQNNFKKLSLLIMDDGGVNLTTYSNNIYTKSEKELIDFFVEAHRILLGLKVFIDNGIVHHDLKPGNIVYNEATNRLNFIDFGLTVTREHILLESEKSTNWIADSYHWSFPFEINFYNKNAYNKMAKSTISEKTQYINDITKNTSNNHIFMNGFKTFLSNIMSQQQNINKEHYINKYITDFYQTILTDIVPGNYKKFINKSISTIDIYGTGIAFNNVLNKCYGILPKPAYDDLKLLFLNMVSSDLSTRYEINEVLTIYENILLQHNFIPPNMSFENHILVNNSKLNKLNNNISIIKQDDVVISPELVEQNINKSPNKCGEHKILNPNTNRCVKKCKLNYTRNDKFKCVKGSNTNKNNTNIHNSTNKKKCPDTKELNDKTNRCVKKCKPDYIRIRNDKFKCVKVSKKNKQYNKKHTSTNKKKCPDTKELNDKTNRCVNKCKPNYFRNDMFKCVKI